MQYNDNGEELPDPIPVEMPLHFRRPESLHEMIARAIRTQMSRDADAAGQESFDEANDFDVMGEDNDPTSRYEIMEDDEFRYAESVVLDKAKKELDNNKAPIKERKGDDDVQSKGVARDRKGVSDAGEERAEAGGKGRSAGDGGDRVSQGRSGD